MTNEPRANEEVVASPQEPMPSSDKTSQVAEVAKPVDQQTEVSASDTETLPDGVSERTRTQFEKLQKQLAEEKAKNKNPFDSIRQTYQPEISTAPLYNTQTGYIDTTELENLRSGVNEARAEIAKLKAERQKEVEEAQTREALSAYPELDPQSGGHNAEFYKATRAVIIDSMMNPNDYGGKALTYKAAADIAKSFNSKALTEAEKAGAEKALQKLGSKEQAALEATGRSDRRNSTVDREDLVERTRKNDTNAVMERLKALSA